MKALIVARDHEMANIFFDLFREIGVAAQVCGDESNARLVLGSGRLEALVLDFDNLSWTLRVITTLRESGSSKNALVFAVASDGTARQRALEQGANFAVERPFQKSAIKQVLHTAYSLMLRERRRYFRYGVCLTIQARTDSGPQMQCTSINISRNGMALNVPRSLDLGESLDLGFSLPDMGDAISASGTVVWDDKHGKAGVSFQCASLEDQNRLGRWLDSHFYQQLNPVQTMLDASRVEEAH